MIFRLKTTFLVLAILFGSIVAVEGVMRILGYKPDSGFPKLISSIEPKSCMRPDSLVGFSLKPGEYTFVYHSGFEFTTNHLPNGFRVTNSNPDSICAIVNFYGGSLFYGLGLNDEDVFTAKLAETVPNILVNNYAIFGHGMVTPLKLLERAKSSGDLPDLAVITYAKYNLARNVYSQPFAKSIRFHRKHFGPRTLKVPYARISNDSLVFGLTPIEYKEVPFADYSSTMNRIQGVYDNYNHASFEPELVDSILITRYLQFAEENRIKLVFAIVDNYSGGKVGYERLYKSGAEVIDISVDHDSPEFNLMPHDGHPNARAHSIYAARCFAYLSALGYIRTD
ncbi:MAG: hypothetical protein ACI85F_003062 [Bacteroidia bacterium]|jgi:hypothetical protein